MTQYEEIIRENAENKYKEENCNASISIDLKYREPTNKDASELKKIMKKYTQEQQNNIAKHYDKIQIHFEKFITILSTRQKEDLNRLFNWVSCHVLKHKLKYNGVRPHRRHKIQNVYVESAKTPSFPSGHAAQYYFVYLILSYYLPAYQKELQNIFVNGSNSRLIGGIHYVQDNVASIELINKLVQYLDLNLDLNQYKLPADKIIFNL